MPQSSDLNKEYLKEIESELRDFEQKSAGSDKTMRLIVYPAILAFIILATYGFYLIQSLASDVNHMARTMEGMADSVDRNMNSIATTMTGMNGDVNVLTGTIKGMSADIGDMSDNTKTMVDSIGKMKNATYDMAASTNNMQRDMWSLNQNISTPLSVMNKFLPWKNNTNGPFPGSAAPLPPSYYPQALPQPFPLLQQNPIIPQQILPQLPIAPTLPVLPATSIGGQSSLGILSNISGKKVNYLPPALPLEPNAVSFPATNI